MDDCYDPVIANALSVSRWVDLKLNMKLIDPWEEVKMPDRGQEDYDPTRKYCKVWDVLATT